MKPTEPETPLQRRLRRRFDAAATRSLAVFNLNDATPEMARFLRLVQRHPDKRPFVARLFIDSFDDSSYAAKPADFL